MSDITQHDIDEQVINKVYSQSYTKKPTIAGVHVFPLKNHVGEDGALSEVIRMTDGHVQGIDGFSVAQINSTKLFPGTIKGWHLHYKQNDLWYVLPSSHLLVGLWDVRRSSDTKGNVMRLSLGGGNAQLVYIPKGVAHGAANVTQEPSEMLYFVDQQFDMQNPDEHRIPWNSLGEDFWKPLKD